MALGVAARRRAPLVAAALVFAALTVMEQLGDPVNTSLVGPYPSAFIVSYSIGANLEGAQAGGGRGAGSSLLVTALVARSTRRADEGLNLVWGWLVIVAAPVLAGRLLRDRARLARALRAAAADDDAEPWAEQAVADERSRIAAELHDVVARALRRMVVDADGAAGLVDAEPAGRRWPSPPSSRPAATRWPRSGACSACCAARTTSWRSRRSRRSPTSPTSSAARAPPGLPVALHVEGEAAPLSAGADLTAYRVVQEALAGRRARGRRRGRDGDRALRADAVELEVVDDGSARPAPMGIAERVALYGGELRTASARDGGQALRARLPLGSAA